MGIMNLAEAAARMAAAAIDIEAAKRAAIEEACVIVEARAKGMIGHPNPGWPPLKPETITHKGGLAMPLLETGEMRDSIQHTVVDSSQGWVGSNLDRAIFHELGTSKIPPRSFLAHSAMESGPEIAKMVAKTIGGAISAGLAGQRVHDFFEIARIAGEAFHSIRETASDLVDSPDEEKQRR
jgi:phage gpG-like protein